MKKIILIVAMVLMLCFSACSGTEKKTAYGWCKKEVSYWFYYDNPDTQIISFTHLELNIIDEANGDNWADDEGYFKAYKITVYYYLNEDYWDDIYQKEYFVSIIYTKSKLGKIFEGVGEAAITEANVLDIDVCEFTNATTE